MARRRREPHQRLSVITYHLSPDPGRQDYLRLGDGDDSTKYYLSTQEALNLADQIFREVTGELGIGHIYRQAQDKVLRYVHQLRSVVNDPKRQLSPIGADDRSSAPPEVP